MLNRVTLMGRLTKDVELRYNGDNFAIARYTLAVDRESKEKQTDFISCVALGKTAEFADKYLQKGTKIVVEGRIQTGSYTNKDGQKVYTTDVLVDKHYFCESLKGDQKTQKTDDFMSVADGIDDEVPFG